MTLTRSGGFGEVGEGNTEIGLPRTRNTTRHPFVPRRRALRHAEGELVNTDVRMVRGIREKLRGRAQFPREHLTSFACPQTK